MGVQATKKRKKALLYLLEKRIEVYLPLLNQTKGSHLSEPVAQRFRTIRKVYLQQLYLIENNTIKVRDRIVSLSKPHIKPIVRGKENKPLEFGIKVHMMQVDGINILNTIPSIPLMKAQDLKPLSISIKLSSESVLIWLLTEFILPIPIVVSVVLKIFKPTLYRKGKSPQIKILSS